jgi:hypothetical protein
LIYCKEHCNIKKSENSILKGGMQMKNSKFETYLVDQDFDLQTKDVKYEESCYEYDREQYPEGFFTEL